MNATFRNFLWVFISVILFSNCAKTGIPNGGPKDSIPPVIVKSNPENFSTQFDQDEIRIYFDEFIKLKDLQQNLIISPPLKYQPLITPLSTSKVLKIKLLDTLLENTTYSINFGQSIVDNNEENSFDYYKYVFSTGDYIDSLKLGGIIQHALLPDPQNATTVMLYALTEDFNDSIIFLEKPTYIATTRDSTNTFELSNLKEGNYRLIALNENINNYIFEPKKDELGYIAETVSLPTDSSYLIKIFKEIPDYKIGRPSHVSKYEILFGYEGEVDSLVVDPISTLPSEWEIRRFKDSEKDTLHYWFKPEINIEETDTLLFTTSYKGTLDTLAVRMRDLFADSLEITKLGSQIFIPRDTLKLFANIPLESVNPEKISIMDKDSLDIPFTMNLDRKNNIANIVFDKQEDQQYMVNTLPEALIDFYGNTNDTVAYGVRTRLPSDYGTLSLTLNNLKSYPVLVELVDLKFKVVASELITENKLVYFDYLEPDKYLIRITYDTNSNGKWDTGNYLRKEQPEEVIYYPGEIEVRANWSLNETFNAE